MPAQENNSGTTMAVDNTRAAGTAVEENRTIQDPTSNGIV